MPNKIVKGKIRELSRKGRRDQEPKWKLEKASIIHLNFERNTSDLENLLNKKRDTNEKT